MGKRIGRHPEKALTVLQARSLREPGRYADGNGLYLVVEKSGSKRWMVRTVVHGRRRDIGLGGFALTSLAEARDAAFTVRKAARSGGDPLAERRKAKSQVPTFSEAAETVHTEQQASWKNAKHAAQWINTLRTYANPFIGSRRVDQVDTPDVLRVLSPIWLTKPETAKRVRQRIHAVLDWAKAAGHRSGENPVDGVSRGLPKQNEQVEHHTALPYADVPKFVSNLRSIEGAASTALALEFLILTAARTSEVLGAKWTEFDEVEALWVVPAERMKKRREHRVPLSSRASAVLKLAKQACGASPFVFPGRAAEKSMSNMALAMVLRRMNVPVTVHGFRSSFRDWAAEATSHPREVAEAALAHVVENRVEAAYRRGDLLAKRRDMMEQWGLFCQEQRADDGDKIESGNQAK